MPMTLTADGTLEAAEKVAVEDADTTNITR